MNGKTEAWGKIIAGAVVPILIALNIPIPDGVDGQTAAAIGLSAATVIGMLVKRPQDHIKKDTNK